MASTCEPDAPLAPRGPYAGGVVPQQDKEPAPEWQMTRDLFLVRNLFPEEVAAKAAAEGIDIPVD